MIPAEEMATQPAASLATIELPPVVTDTPAEDEPEMMGFLGKLKQKEEQKEKKLELQKKMIIQEAQEQAEYSAPKIIALPEFSAKENQEIRKSIHEKKKHLSIAERYQEKLEREDQDLEDLKRQQLAAEQNDMLEGVQDTLRSQGIHISDAELEQNLNSVQQEPMV